MSSAVRGSINQVLRMARLLPSDRWRERWAEYL